MHAGMHDTSGVHAPGVRQGMRVASSSRQEATLHMHTEHERRLPHWSSASCWRAVQHARRDSAVRAGGA